MGYQVGPRLRCAPRPKLVDMEVGSEFIAQFLSSYHCGLVHRAFAGVAVARALSSDGDVPEAVEVLPQGELIQEVVGSGLETNEDKE